MTNHPALTFFLVAGEESGDIHGARLIHLLKNRTLTVDLSVTVVTI